MSNDRSNQFRASISLAPTALLHSVPGSFLECVETGKNNGEEGWEAAEARKMNEWKLGDTNGSQPTVAVSWSSTRNAQIGAWGVFSQCLGPGFTFPWPALEKRVVNRYYKWMPRKSINIKFILAEFIANLCLCLHLPSLMCAFIVVYLRVIAFAV